jgi:protein TonB
LNFTRKLTPIEAGFLISLGIHALLFFGFQMGAGIFNWRAVGNDPLEIDLSRPFRLAPAPDKQFRAANPGAGAAPVITPDPTQKPTPSPGLGTDWIKPGPKATDLVPLPDGETLGKAGTSTAPATGLGGLGVGEGEGEVDWVYLTQLPLMLNKDEIARHLQRLYPQSERMRGREGDVVVNLHVNRDGTVTGVDVIQSDSPAFEGAAREVMGLAKFAPAKVGARAVSVKIRQTVAFRLRD